MILIEALTVLITVAILAALILPRFMGRCKHPEGHLRRVRIGRWPRSGLPPRPGLAGAVGDVAMGSRYSQGGVTLIELITVLVIAGILAAFIVPRFIGSDGFAQADAQTTLESVLERARSTAIVTGNTQSVSISQSGVTWNQVSETWPSGVSPNPASVAVTFSPYTGSLSVSPSVSQVGFGNGQEVCLSPSGLSYACL